MSVLLMTVMFVLFPMDAVFDKVLVKQDAQPTFPLDLPGSALSVLAEYALSLAVEVFD